MLSLVPPVTRGLLRPHLEDLDNKIQPGAVILTWASMNIDGYLHHIHQASSRTRADLLLLQSALDIMQMHAGFYIIHSMSVLLNLAQMSTCCIIDHHCPSQPNVPHIAGAGAS